MMGKIAGKRRWEEERSLSYAIYGNGLDKGKGIKAVGEQLRLGV